MTKARLGGIRRRLDDVERHRAALREHLAPYAGQSGAKRFVEDSGSSGTDPLSRAYLVQASFENTVNHFVAIAKEVATAESAGADVDGLTALRLLVRERILDDRTRRELHEAQVIRNGLQHAYAETAPVELLRAAQAVDRSGDGYCAAISRWLDRQV